LPLTLRPYGADAQPENLAVNGKLIAILAGVVVLAAIPVKLIFFPSHSTPDDGIPLVSADTPLGEKDAAPSSGARGKTDRGTGATRVSKEARVPTWEEVIRDCEESVAVVKGKIGHGTGFLLPNGVLATNAHVINLEFEENLRVFFPSAPKRQQGPFKAQFIWADRKRDLAFLFVECDVSCLQLADEYDFRKGQEVLAIGNPGINRTELLRNAVSRGMMSTLTKLDKQVFYQMDISVNPGNSGGPVLDQNGNVLGMITAKLRDKDGIAFAIPLEDLHYGYEQVVGQGRESTPELLAWHRACTVLERFVAIGDTYGAALDTCSRAMDTAVAQGQTPNAGLRAVPEATRREVQGVNRMFADSLEANVHLTLDEPNLYPEDKERIRNLWNVVREMKTMYDSPNGTVDAYRKKKDQLRQQFEKLLTFEQPRKPQRQ
jgi:S1-C subfamily serine protease